MREPDGFREYVVMRQSALHRAAYLMSGDLHLAEDLVQTTLAKVWSKWTRVSATSELDAYVHRILVNTFISSTRRRWWGERPTGDRLPHTVSHDPYPDWTDREALLGAVRRLPPRQRAVITLRYFLDQTEAATAQSLGCSVGTVKSHTARALTSLREHLQEQAAPTADTTHEESRR